MRGRPKPLNLAAGTVKSQFSLTESGTFCQGDITIGKSGTQIRTRPPISPIAECRPGSGSSTRPMTAQSPADGRSASRGTISGSEGPFDLCMDDVDICGVLGSGSSGVVRYGVHRPTGDPLVIKTIPFPVNDDLVRKNVLAELKTMHLASHPNVVRCLHSCLVDGAVTLALEHMDAGSVEAIFRAHPAGLEEWYLCDIARQVLAGLHYLHLEARIVHRDIKPSNLLVSTRGDVKIADFGVSGQLASDVSKCMSWVGTVTYMSPERIRGEPYRANTDTWSLGLTLLEGALGRFPYYDHHQQEQRRPGDSDPSPPSDSRRGAPACASASGRGGSGGCPSIGFWDVLDRIVEKDAPGVPSGAGFSEEFRDFVGRCLEKDGGRRASTEELLRHPWLRMHGDCSLADVAVAVEVPRGKGRVDGGGSPLGKEAQEGLQTARLSKEIEALGLGGR